MSDLAKEIAQTVVRIKTEMRKASFASRSEAGRYAANQRWKGQGKKAKTPLDDLSIRGMTPAKMAADELRTWIDEQEGLLEAMQGLASKAELKQQKGLITLARRDLRRMEGSETKVKPKTSKPGKTISSQEANAVERVDLFMRSTANLDQTVLDRVAEKYKTDPPSDADRKLLDETKKEMLAAGEAAKTAIQDAFAGGGQGGTDKLGKTFRSSSRKIVKQMVAEGLERKFPTDPKPENTIRGTILQTKVMVLDRLALELKDIPEALTASYGVGKAQFASRSEAGRYAANMRWKGQGQSTAASAGSKTPKQKYDFSPQDYKMVRDAMPQLSAADAKKLTQYLLDNNAFGDTSEMSNQEMSNEFALYLNDALGGGSSSASSEPRGKSPSGLDRGRDILDNDTNDAGDTIDDLNSRYQNDNEYIAFEDLPKGGFREQVIAAFIDQKAAGYYDEPGRLKGPYDRPSYKMTDKGYAKARAHALRGHPDGRESDLEDYWDDNSSIFWDEYAMITDQYSTNE
jgi:hypothetical protein